MYTKYPRVASLRTKNCLKSLFTPYWNFQSKQLLGRTLCPMGTAHVQHFNKKKFKKFSYQNWLFYSNIRTTIHALETKLSFHRPYFNWSMEFLFYSQKHKERKSLSIRIPFTWTKHCVCIAIYSIHLFILLLTFTINACEQVNIEHVFDIICVKIAAPIKRLSLAIFSMEFRNTASTSTAADTLDTKTCRQRNSMTQ